MAAEKKGTIYWTKPTLMVLDPYNGSGHADDVVGTVTAEFDKDNLRIDAKGGAFGYSWNEVAGLTGGAYSSEHKLSFTE